MYNFRDKRGYYCHSFQSAVQIIKMVSQAEVNNSFCFLLFPPAVFRVLTFLAALLLPASSCPPSCFCSSESLVVDCGDRGLSSLPPLHLLPPGSRSLLLTNNKLASLGASAFANLSSLEVCSLLFFIRQNVFMFLLYFKMTNK